MQHSTNHWTWMGLAAVLAIAVSAAGKPPPGNGNGNGGGGGGGGGNGGGGGKTSLSIDFRCPVAGTLRDCVLAGEDQDPVQGDGMGAYVDGTGGVQAFLNSAGTEIVLNTGKIATGRDVYWRFAGGVNLANPEDYPLDNTDSLMSEQHATTLVIGRNAGVDIRGLSADDGPVAIDMFANLRINLTGRKRDLTVIFPRFESARVEGGVGERCAPGMGGTDVTIRCVDDSGGACSQWLIEGTDPELGGPAMACVFAVYPDSAYRDDYPLGPFEITATAIE